MIKIAMCFTDCTTSPRGLTQCCMQAAQTDPGLFALLTICRGPDGPHADGKAHFHGLPKDSDSGSRGPEAPHPDHPYVRSRWPLPERLLWSSQAVYRFAKDRNGR